MASSPGGQSLLTYRLAVMAITAGLYAVGKWATASVPTPWGVGELLVATFLPALMVTVCETFPAAVGAGIGTFIGDFLVSTTPALSLVAGVPANFIAFLFFGWFVKKYRSWPSYVAASVAFVTLGNLIAAVMVYLFITPLTGGAIPSSAILGLTIFWNTTSIPAIIIAVPLLLRAIKPLYGRSKMLVYFPEWSTSVSIRDASYALVGAFAYVAIGVAVFVASPNSVATAPGLTYFGLAALIVVVFGPIASVFAGRRDTPKPIVT